MFWLYAIVKALIFLRSPRVSNILHPLDRTFIYTREKAHRWKRSPLTTRFRINNFFYTPRPLPTKLPRCRFHLQNNSKPHTFFYHCSFALDEQTTKTEQKKAREQFRDISFVRRASHAANWLIVNELAARLYAPAGDALAQFVRKETLLKRLRGAQRLLYQSMASRWNSTYNINLYVWNTVRSHIYEK